MSHKFQANVQIKSLGDRWSVLINGHEMADEILARGFNVQFLDNGQALVTVTLMADLRLDLPDAEIELVEP